MKALSVLEGVIIALARLVEHPSCAVRRSVALAGSVGALGLFLALLASVLSLFFGTPAFTLTSVMWKVVWNVAQLTVPLWILAMVVAVYFEYANRRFTLYACGRHIGIALVCMVMVLLFTIGTGLTLFRQSGYSGAWFAALTQEFFLGMGWYFLLTWIPAMCVAVVVLVVANMLHSQHRE